MERGSSYQQMTFERHSQATSVDRDLIKRYFPVYVVFSQTCDRELGKALALHEELILTLEQLRKVLDDMVVCGLRAVGLKQRERLLAFRDELAGIGVLNLSMALSELEGAIRTENSQAGEVLFRTLTTLRIFERLLTIEVADASFESAIADPLRESESN